MKKNQQIKRFTNEEVKILTRLFPEGIKAVKIWNGLITLLGKRDYKNASVEKLEVTLDCRFKIKLRIQRHFPGLKDKLYLIQQGDTGLLHRLTQDTWYFAGEHKAHSHDAIVLHGRNPEEILLDWAAQAVITILLRYINVSI